MYTNAAHHEIPVKVFLMNNGHFGMVRQPQIIVRRQHQDASALLPHAHFGVHGPGDMTEALQRPRLLHRRQIGVKAFVQRHSSLQSSTTFPERPERITSKPFWKSL